MHSLLLLLLLLLYQRSIHRHMTTEALGVVMKMNINKEQEIMSQNGRMTT